MQYPRCRGPLRGPALRCQVYISQLLLILKRAIWHGAPVETIQRQEEKKARRAYLKAADFEAHGYSDGCDGCARLQAGMDPRPHTETCRSRLGEELAKGDSRRWQNAKAREMARTATDAALVEIKRRKLEGNFEPIGNPSLEERASRAKK